MDRVFYFQGKRFGVSMMYCEGGLYRMVYSMLYMKNDFGADGGGVVVGVYIDPIKNGLNVTRICFFVVRKCDFESLWALF